MLDMTSFDDALPEIDDNGNKLTFDDDFGVPIELTDLDVWLNYVNEDIYAMDVKLREYLRKNITNKSRKSEFKTAAPLVFAWMFGRRPESSDSATMRMLNRMLRYYCTSRTSSSHLAGKKVSCVYKFSPYSTKNKRPYSIRLRIELRNAADHKNRPDQGGHIEG